MVGPRCVGAVMRGERIMNIQQGMINAQVPGIKRVGPRCVGAVTRGREYRISNKE